VGEESGVQLRSKPTSESSQAYDDGLSQALSLVVGPVLFAFIGWILDRVFGTGPLLLIVFGIFGFLAAVTALYYRYKAAIERHEADKPWNRRGSW
jgi:F0F1-type ATP synthase assembly protein I